MRYLITGGAGFIGSHLVDSLLTDGHEVICVDNFFTGNKKNVSHHLGNNSFELIRHDITLPLHIEVDRIFHLACPASPINYQVNPVKTLKTSVMGTINMLGLAKRVKARILFSSTSEVYGDPKVHPQVEEYWGNVNPIGPRSCYDEGKRAAETLMFDYHRQSGVDIRVVRIFNTYGPRMAANDGRVVSNFIVQALQGQDITLFGSGEQTRSFCYVDDMIRGLRLMMDNDDHIGPINMGNPGEFTVKQLADKVLELTGSSSRIVQRELPQDDPRIRRPDITKAEERLNWKPGIQLSEGLQQTINWFKEHLPVQ